MTTETKQIQDPHTHPLYRPHMGDMTGWRFLEVGEITAANYTDEGIYQNDPTDVWDAQCSGQKVKENHNCVYRRRVAPASKPADQPRFVTVVVDGRKHDLESLAKSFGAIDIREGNALARLDQFEDNMIEATRKACRGEAA